MRRLFILIMLLPFLSNSCVHKNNTDHHKANTVHQKNNVTGDDTIGVNIPAEWIEKVRHFDYTKNNKELIREFGSFIKSDTLFNSHTEHVGEDYNRILNSIFVDLDGERGEELICLLGWYSTSPDLCVFKEIKGKWHLLYKEHIDTFYDPPTLSVAGNFSKNKVFYLRRVYNHGSGVYEDGCNFYKLINNKIYNCLNLVNRAHIYGWGLFMNEAIKTNFEFSGDETDQVKVDYDYNFFPGAVNSKDCSWCANEDISLIKGDDVVYCVWDKKSFAYKLDIPAYKNQVDDLTAKKIACFGDFGNDSLFVTAFKSQIDQVLKQGTKQQKEILKKYLAKVKADKVARTAELKVTGKAGRTTFYGTDKKK